MLFCRVLWPNFVFRTAEFSLLGEGMGGVSPHQLKTCSSLPSKKIPPLDSPLTKLLSPNHHQKSFPPTPPTHTHTTFQFFKTVSHCSCSIFVLIFCSTLCSLHPIYYWNQIWSILVHCMTNLSIMFLFQYWRLETSYRLFLAI